MDLEMWTRKLTEGVKSVSALLLAFVFLLLLVEFFSFATLRTWDFARGDFRRNSGLQSEAAKLPFNWSQEQGKFFSELMDYRHYNYKAFVGWKNTEFKGRYLNIDAHGRRVTGHELKYPQAPTIRFFGGSTMWSYGVADESTIPALIGGKEKLNAINYAEQAYNSRHSLNVLIENINLIKREDLIVFYDGLNDSHNCWMANSTNGHVMERYVQDALHQRRMLEKDSAEMYSIKNIVLFYYEKTNAYSLIVRANRKWLSLDNESEVEWTWKAEGSVCDDQSKAEEVANFLFTSWKVTEILLKGVGVKFACVLQPTPYSLSFKPHYYDAAMAQYVKAVYPSIRERARDLDCFVDLSKSLQNDNYIDACCHANRIGNEEIADLLISKVVRPKIRYADSGIGLDE